MAGLPTPSSKSARHLNERPAMASTFTLESLKEETRKKFAPVTVELSDGSEVVLSSVLKLSSEDRKAVQKSLQTVADIDENDDSPETVDRLIEAISKIFYAIADKPARLLSEVDDPDPMVKVSLMSHVVSSWAKETNLGEA